jgi:hypothetical protein
VKTTRKIGKYRLESEIGRGSCGQVFRAFEPSGGRTVAIKILTTDNDKDLLARFKREATVTRKLRHKNIVTIYDYGEQENTPYLVMEYLEGEDLNASLSSGHLSTLFDKTSVMAQVAEGLQYAHHQGIFHRDIKPANIMILSDGTAKIMDFGIAGVLSEFKKFKTRRARQDWVLGTLSYIAPEVFQGNEVDALCDIFSFGVIYYELVAGKHPFADDQQANVIYDITATQPVSTLAPQCLQDLEQLIARAIHKDRELRYQSFEDLLFDLTPVRLQLQSAEEQTLIRKAETLVDAKHIREAQTVVGQVLQLDPNNSLARELLEKLNREGQLRDVRGRCEQLIVSGTAQVNALQYAKAVEMFEVVLRLDPNNVEAQKLLEQTRTTLKKREHAEALIAQAKRELEADQLTDAYRSVLESLQHIPENKEAAALLEMIRAAIKARERQRQLAKGLARAEEMLNAARPEEAEALLSELEVSYPAAARIRQLRVEVARAIQEKKRRRQLVEKLTPIRKLMSEKKWSVAVASLSALMKQFPDEDEVRSLLVYGQDQLELQRKTERIEQIPREARSANEAQDFERALKLINDGLRLYPDEPSLRLILARTEELRNEHQRQIAIQDTTARANKLAAKNDFSAALALIDLTGSTWKTGELADLRRQIQTKQEEFQRVRAIAKACTSIKLYLDRGLFEDALMAGEEALARFVGEPSITMLVSTAQARLAEQKREARIKAVRDEATVTAAEDRFSQALELLRNALRELGEDPSLTALHDHIEAQKKEHERQQAIDAAAATLRALIEQSDYDAAVEAGRLALENFPAEGILTKLVETAERSFSQQKRARQIVMVQEKARSLASNKDFDAALRLVHDCINELGYEPALEDLVQSIENSRQEHKKREEGRVAKNRAKQLMDSKEYAEAIALLEENLEKYPDEAVMESLLTEAREHLAAQRSKAVDAIIRKARELVRAQEFQTALNFVRHGIREYSDDARLIAMLAEIRAAIFEMEKERAIRTALNSAAALQEKGKFSKAAELLEHTLTKAPGQTAIEQALALVKQKIATQQKVNAVLDDVCQLMSRGNFDEALANVRQGLVVFPEEPALSSLFEEIKESQRSNAVAAAAQEVGAFRSAGDLAGASQRLEEVLATFPNEPTLVALKSRIQSETEAEQKRQNLSAFTNEIRHLLDEERVDDVIVRLQDALREHPGEGELTALYAYAKEIAEARHRAEEIIDLAKRAMTLLQTGRPREAESLLLDAVNLYPDEETFLPLLDRAKAEAVPLQARSGATPHSNVGTSKTEIHAETRASAGTKIDAVDRASSMNIAQLKLVRPLRIAILLGIAIVIALVAWIVLFSRRPEYKDQFDSARAYFEQKEFVRAMEALQRIPSSSSLYKQAQGLLAAARDAETQRSIRDRLAQAAQQHNQDQDQESLSTLQKVLNSDPNNKAAKSLRDEIQLASFRKKTREEQDQYVAATLARAQELFKTGNLDSAKVEIQEVILVRPDDPIASSLNGRILSQLEAARRMNDERSKWAQAKASAEKATASEFDPTRFAAAHRAEEAALRQEQTRKFDEAAKKFAEAAALYDESFKAALAENRARTDRENQQKAALQLQRNQAEAARMGYEQNRTKARDADAEAKASDTFQVASRLASDAQARFGRGDFAGARGEFEQASNGMVQAADAATRATRANQQAAQRAMDTAQADMETAKRALSGRDARASVEEGRAQQLVQEGKLAEATTAYQTAASLYRDAAQQREENERQAIRACLDRYKAAYERKDMAAMRAAFPNLSGIEENAVRINLETARLIQITLVVTEIQVSGGVARAATRQQLNVRTTDNKTVQSPQISIVFNLRKRGGSWVIDSIIR